MLGLELSVLMANFWPSVFVSCLFFPLSLFLSPKTLNPLNLLGHLLRVPVGRGLSGSPAPGVVGSPGIPSAEKGIDRVGDSGVIS